MKLTSQQRRASLLIALGIILMLALSLRLISIQAEPYSLDEAFSVANAQLTLPQITEVIKHENYPPLYPYVLHVWIGWFGAGEAATRSLSVLAGLVSIVVMFLLGKVVRNTSTGIMAAVVTAVSALHMEYTMDARMYAFMFLWSALAALFLYRFLFQRNKHALAWFILVSILNIYTHYFGLLLLGGQALAAAWFFLRHRRETGLRQLGIMAGGIIMISFAPWLPYMIERIIFFQKGFWLTMMEFQLPDIFFHAPSYIYLSFPYASELPIFRYAIPLYYIVTCIGIIAGVVFLWRAYRERLVLFMPIIVLYAAGLITGIYSFRYSTVIMPLFLLLWAIGMAAVLKQSLKIGIIMIGCSLLLVLPPWLEVLHVHYDWAGLADTVTANKQSGDSVVLYSPMHQYLMEYYDNQDLVYQSFFPLAVAGRRNDQAHSIKYSGFIMAHQETINTEMQWLTRESDRVWLVQYQQQLLDPDNLIQQWLADQYQLVDGQQFPCRFYEEDVELTLYQRR